MKENLRQINIQPITFCQKPSKQYLEMLEKCGGDPRSVIGHHAINKSGGSMEKGWFPAWDARDFRTQTIFMTGR